MRYLIILLLFISCRDFKKPDEILAMHGYTEIQYLPHDLWACKGRGQKTHHSKQFKARKDGKEVKGNICYTYDGNYSIEVKD